MPVEIVMPRLSDSMEEGKVVRWLKQEGDPVQRGETLAEIETDKAVMDMEAFESGTVDRIVVKEGESVPVGEPIAFILRPGESPSAGPSVAAKEKTAAPSQEKAVTAGLAETPTVTPEVSAPPSAGPSERIKASPLARRLAEERGIDLSQVRGTGPDGRITKEDIEAYRERPRPAPAPVEVVTPSPAPARVAAEAEAAEIVQLGRMQATVAKRMIESKTTVPHFYVTTEVDMSEASRIRRFVNDSVDEESKISYNDLIIRAAALALRRFPEINAFYQNGSIARQKQVNIAVAVALPDGLVTPVIHNADQKTLGQIAREARSLAERARSGRVAPGDYEGGTFTVSNLGMFDVDEFQAIINPPQSAILAIGAIRPKPVVADGQIVVSERMRATLSCDHRVFYGTTAAQYLQEFKRLLQNPMALLL